MKIAVPTNDQHNISNHFFHTKSFKVYTIEGGDIINEEYKYYNKTEAKDKPEIIYNLISDCKALIIEDFDPDHLKYLQEKEIEIVVTDNKVIIQAVIDYYKETKRLESNFCCCP